MWGGGQTDTVGTVTVVMSGKAGGSQLKGDKFKTRATPYIPEMLQLLAMLNQLFALLLDLVAKVL